MRRVGRTAVEAGRETAHLPGMVDDAAERLHHACRIVGDGIAQPVIGDQMRDIIAVHPCGDRSFGDRAAIAHVEVDARSDDRCQVDLL